MSAAENQEYGLERSPPPTFVLVHGTWARKAHWTTPAGALVQRLASEFPGCAVQSVPWSGRNRFKDRIAAARRIQEVLLSRSDTGPVFLIGHSHGGSAITYALRESGDACGRVTGAAFLGTPFMSLAVRGATSLLRGALVLVAILSVLLLVSFAIAYVADPDPWSGDHALRDCLALGGVGLLVLLAAWIGVRSVRNTDAVRRRAERITSWATALETSTFPAIRAIFLRSTGDEVALVMGFLQLLSYFSNMAGTVLAWSLQRTVSLVAYLAQRLWGKLVLGLLTCVFALALTLSGLMGRTFGALRSNLPDMLNPFSRGWSLDWVGVPLVNGLLEGLYRISLGVVDLVVGGIVALGAGLLLLLLLTAAISTLTLLVFGRFDPMSALWLDMAAEPVPHGAHTLVHIRWNQVEQQAGDALDLRLRHSEPYSDPHALGVLCRWIREGMTTTRATLTLHAEKTEAS